MGEVNVLSGGIEILTELKNNLTVVDELKKKSAEMSVKQTELEKQIATKEKAMESEINATVTKRRSEVEASFDSQINKTRDRIKMVKGKRDKYKNTKVSERIGEETSELREKLAQLKQDVKGVFKLHRIPAIFNNRYFFSLYMPGEVIDFCIILLTIVVVLALPLGIRLFLPENLKTWWMLLLLYVAVVGVAMGLFVIVFKKVRTKYLSSLEEAKKIKEKIFETKKRIKRMEKSIRKDTDESSYGLEKFDEEIGELERTVEAIIEEKKKALATFEAQTKVDISNEIKARCSEEIDKMKADNEEAYNEQRTAEARINAYMIELSSKYEPYIGKENLSIAMVDSLIDIINGGDALNIADALSFYKKQMSTPPSA